MPSFSAGNASFTPSTTNDNWTLDLTAQTYYLARVVMFGWGGDGASSVGYSTRWVRPTTAGSGTKTSLTIGGAQPNYTTADATIQSTYGTAQPVLPATAAGNLWLQDWNVQGGSGVVVLPLHDQWYVIGGILTGQLSCRNLVGTDANLSSYHVTWEE